MVVSGKSICQECNSALFDYIPPDYYRSPPTPAYYKCPVCGTIEGDLDGQDNQDGYTP